MRFCLSLIVVALALATALPAENWPAFRGPTGDGVAEATSLPTRWSESENIRWKTAIHGKGWSSPVVWGDQIWLTTANEEGVNKKAPVPRTGEAKAAVEKVTFFAVGVDRATGKVLYDLTLGSETNPGFCHDFNSYASPTPVIEEGRVYTHFGSNGTWCLDTASGKVLWERRDLACNHHRGSGSSPILHKNLLILIFDGYDVQYVAALDKSTGKTVWKKDRNINYSRNDGDIKKAYATGRVMEIGGKSQLICPSAECTIAYDPATGDELWRVAHGGMNGAARPVGAHGLLFLTSGHTRQLLAVKESLSGTVSKDAVVWRAEKIVPTRPSLILHNDLLYMVSDDGIASCLDALTGKVQWSERQNGEFSASPILAGEHIYMPNQTGKTMVVKTGCMASPAIAGDALLLRTKTHLYSIGRK
jgi:outer membrane protein assembly factor BamB